MSDDKSGQCTHGYYGLCPHCYDSLRAELAELRARAEPVLDSPATVGAGTFAAGLPWRKG